MWKLVFFPRGETGRQEGPCSQIFQSKWQAGLQQIRSEAAGGSRPFLTFYSGNSEGNKFVFSFSVQRCLHLQCLQYIIVFAGVLYEDKFKMNLIPQLQTQLLENWTWCTQWTPVLPYIETYFASLVSVFMLLRDLKSLIRGPPQGDYIYIWILIRKCTASIDMKVTLHVYRFV
jgi:hypothetical protein